MITCPVNLMIICSQFWQHKNHMAFFRTLGLLSRQGDHSAVFCVGALTPECKRNDVRGFAEAFLAIARSAQASPA